MIMLGILDEQAVTLMLRLRVMLVWEALAPYVHREREINPVGAHLLAGLEAWAAKAAVITPEAVDRFYRVHGPRTSS